MARTAAKSYVEKRKEMGFPMLRDAERRAKFIQPESTEAK